MAALHQDPGNYCYEGSGRALPSKIEDALRESIYPRHAPRSQQCPYWARIISRKREKRWEESLGPGAASG